MDIDEEEAAWDVVRDRISIEVESGEFTPLNKKPGTQAEAEMAANSSALLLQQAAAASAYDEDDEEDDEGGTRLLDLDDQQKAGPSAPKSGRKSLAGNKQSINQTLESLLGQANLEHARSRTRQAMAYLFEAIKLGPYHAQTYKELADIYSELGQQEKSFEFRLLAALLWEQRTEADEWDRIGELARLFGRLELAVACLAKAIRKEPGNWEYYEKRIQILDSIGDQELAMKTRLLAAQSVINSEESPVNFAWIDKLIKTAADYFCSLKDEEKATEALEIFILRSREFGRSIDFEHLALLGMWMGKGRFLDSAKSILALHQPLVEALTEEGEPAIQINFTTVGYLLDPFPPPPNIHWRVEPQLPTMFLSHLIICLVHMSQFHLVVELTDLLLERPVGQEEENAYLEIARSLHTMDQLGLAIEYMVRLRAARPEFADNPDAWFLYGYFHQLLDSKSEVARNAYEMVINIQPGHIDARINLSTILQHMGQGELALETLKDLNLDYACSQIPDERLLIRQAEMLFQQRKRGNYISCLRMLLIPHFYAVHQMGNELLNVQRRKSEKLLRTALKRCALAAVRGSPLERMVKRLGLIAYANHRPMEDLNANELHDYVFKLAEALYLAGQYEEMLRVVCYAFLHPKISKITGSQTFLNLLFFASIKARDFTLAFEFLRYHIASAPRTLKGRIDVELQQQFGQASSSSIAALENLRRIFAAMNFILCQHQSVNYHRFIMRQLVKQPDSDALHIISGNNSLITGAYRHALGEYFAVWLRQRDNPLLCMLIALTFGHIACKKDISSRHMVAIRALSFMSKYGQLRSASLGQEVHYNRGRLFHQMGCLALAVNCYQRVLSQEPTPLVWTEDPVDGSAKAVPAHRYDLRRQAAYNLALIYESSGNRPMARHILEQFCTI